MLNLSGVGLEPGMADAIEHRSISSGLIRALRARSIDVLHDLVESPTDLAGLAPALTMVIVGEDSTHHLVGAMLALPPFEFLAQITMAGVPLSIAARSALDIVKLKSLGVDEGSRGAGIGMALVEYCTNIYFDLGYKLAFGQIRAGSGLETYYSRIGFDVLAPQEGISLATLGMPIAIQPLAGEHLIARWRSYSTTSMQVQLRTC